MFAHSLVFRVRDDLLDADLLHGAALLAVGVPAHVEFAERDLHGKSMLIINNK